MPERPFFMAVGARHSTGLSRVAVVAVCGSRKLMPSAARFTRNVSQKFGTSSANEQMTDSRYRSPNSTLNHRNSEPLGGVVTADDIMRGLFSTPESRLNAKNLERPAKKRSGKQRTLAAQT